MATYRAFRLGSESDLLKGAPPSVPYQQPSDQRMADAQKDFHGLYGLQCAKGSGHRAENTDFPSCRYLIQADGGKRQR